MSLYPRVLRYLRPHAGIFLVAAVAMFIFAFLDAFSLALLIPFLQTLFGTGEGGGGEGGQLERLMDATVGRVVDLHGDQQQAIQGIIIFILVVVALKNIFDFIQSVLVARIEQGVTRDLRNEVYEHLLTLDLAFFGRTRTGQIISRLTNDVEQLRTLGTRELAKTLSSVFEFVAAVVLMLGLSVKLTIAAFLVVPGAMAIWGPLVRKLRRGDRRVLDLAGQVSAHIQETLSGVRLVKTASAEGHERTRFRRLTADYFDTYVRTHKWRALAAPMTEMMAAVGTVLLLWYGAHLVLVQGELSSAEFIGFLVLSMRLYSPVKYLSKLPALVQPGLVGAERVFEFLDAPIEIRDQPGAVALEEIRTGIRYEGVSFAYREDEPVLTDLTLDVAVGTVVALVGPSGAGKSTLVDLLGRFYEVSAGRILIDGQDIRSFTVESLRRKMGIVSQDTVLFHDTVRANIAYGLGDATDGGIERAARAAHAHGFITALPHGYDTVVGERGTELSGGQRQRISIARAILRDPPILVFDEATSALDTESEQAVQAAIETLLAGRTVFMIAHRLSTIRKADQILVLEGGRLVEKGGHEELLAAQGLYSRLHALQVSGVPAL